MPAIIGNKSNLLARLHFSAEELLLYPRCRRQRPRPKNVRVNVKVMEFQSLCIFSCILTLLIILIKPLTTKAHDRRASGDCGTSGSNFYNTQGSKLTLVRWPVASGFSVGPVESVLHWPGWPVKF